MSRLTERPFSRRGRESGYHGHSPGTPLTQQFRILLRTDPEILHGLPSTLEELAVRSEQVGWRPTRLRRIFTCSMSAAAQQFASRWLLSPDVERENIEVLTEAVMSGSGHSDGR